MPTKPLQSKAAQKITATDKQECAVATLAREAARIIRAMNRVDESDHNIMSLLDCCKQGGDGRKDAGDVSRFLHDRLCAIEIAALHVDASSQLGAGFHLLLSLRPPTAVMPDDDMDAYEAMRVSARVLIEDRIAHNSRMAWSAFKFLMPSGFRDEDVDPDQWTLEEYYGQGGCTLNNSLDGFIQSANRQAKAG